MHGEWLQIGRSITNMHHQTKHSYPVPTNTQTLTCITRPNTAIQCLQIHKHKSSFAIHLCSTSHPQPRPQGGWPTMPIATHPGRLADRAHLSGMCSRSARAQGGLTTPTHSHVPREDSLVSSMCSRSVRAQGGLTTPTYSHDPREDSLV